MKADCTKLQAKKQKFQQRSNLAATATVEEADSEESASETSDYESDTSYNELGFVSIDTVSNTPNHQEET